MNRIYFLICTAFFWTTTTAQGSKDLIGKWQIVSIDNGVYYNFKKDSMFINNAITATSQGKKDSAETIISLITAAKQYKNYSLLFSENEKYQEVKNDVLVAEGRYEPNFAHASIELSPKRGGRKNNNFFRFKFIEDKLQILIPNLPTDIYDILLLERIY